MRMAVPQFDRVVASVKKPRQSRLSRRPKPRPEKAEQALTLQLLRSIGAHVYVLGTVRPQGDYRGTCQTAGLPDLWVMLPPSPCVCSLTDEPHTRPGKALWIEMKRHGGRVRPEQKVFAQRCQEAGVAHVTGTCDDVIRYLCDGGWLKASSLPHYRQPKEAK